jgi:FMN phosphatase YigB (HAD superfamily)
MHKKIITDCDGVLLDWSFAFDVWMGERGYARLSNTDHIFYQNVRYGLPEDVALDCISKFNESGAVGFLPPFRDAQEYVKKLAEDGWRFEVVSCLHIDKYAQKLREKNLKHLFGEVFDYINCSLDFKKSKLEFLKEQYKGKNYFWIEDNISHAESGKQVGLRSIVMDHPYNKNWTGDRVYNWEGLYKLIKNNISLSQTN